MSFDYIVEIEKLKQDVLLCKDNIRKRLFVINDIIQLKQLSGNATLILETYQDIKDYIITYINYSNSERFDYDHINIPCIIDLINALAPEHRIALLKYLKEKLELSEISISKYKILSEIRKNEIIYLKQNPGFTNYFKLVFIASSLNIYTLLLSLFVLFLIEGIFLMPAPIKGWETYRIHYDNISQNYLLNHYLNILGGAIDISQNFKVIPLNEVGFLSLFLAKLFFILIILNYLVREIKNRVGFN